MLSLLSVAMLGAIIFAEPIVWLLFQRGHFTHADTMVTSNVLTMYMIGLIPFGLSKLFSLYLYASHRQAKAAKIATISLIANIIASLSLMSSMGAAGLALAGSIGGWVLFILTLREIGINRLKSLTDYKKIILLTLSLMFAGILFDYINSWILSAINI